MEKGGDELVSPVLIPGVEVTAVWVMSILSMASRKRGTALGEKRWRDPSWHLQPLAMVKPETLLA